MALSLAVTASPVRAADFSDPEWPCIQRKVPHLWPGQMWAGPPIPDPLPDWRADADVAELAHLLAARRTSDAEAEALIADFAAGLGEDRAQRLTLLFAGAFALIDAERTQIIGGIGRYARKQTALADRLDATREAASALEARPSLSFDEADKLEALQDQILWDTRIFKERQQSLTYVCESPVILEQRAFWLARTIMAQLP
ncbi:hypothetical protein H0I76_11795 [Limibaculum sp. M0105]|uniref:Uncharacterized protein n=1 Tax=Thermohalobaculum xanthum TaxID=2753746 RepID=A0A8J7SHR5_9RHOB|nr:hypothetical protein [Thermohalobaculum xanthum]